MLSAGFSDISQSSFPRKRESRATCPAFCRSPWIPAFAGMTEERGRRVALPLAARVAEVRHPQVELALHLAPGLVRQLSHPQKLVDLPALGIDQQGFDLVLR